MDQVKTQTGGPHDSEQATIAETVSMKHFSTSTEKEEKNTSTVENVPAGPDPTPSALPAFPDGGWRAWLVIAGVAALNFATFGVSVSWGTFQAYYEQTLLKDHTSSTIAWIGSLQFALIFMPGSVTGRLLDIGYYKLPLGISSILLVVCALLIAQCTEYWQFLLCQGIGFGLACGFIFPSTLGLVSQWFHVHRALAFGFTACGTSLGGIIFPIMIRFLLPQVGFQWTVRIMALVMAVALAFGFIATRTRLPPRPVGKLFDMAVIKSANLLLYCAASFFAFLGIYALLTFLAVSATINGISRDMAFYLISITNGASIFGRIAAGFLGDRYGPLNMLIPFTLVVSAVTYAWPYAHNLGGYICITVFYGIAFGAYVGLLPSPAASLGPLSSVGARIGFQLTFMSFSILIGPPIAGAIRSTSPSGGFEAAGAYAGSSIAVGVIFMVLTRKSATGKWIGGKI